MTEQTNEQLTREQWIEAAYQELCRQLGAPEDAQIEKNMREWAASLAEDDADHGWDSYYTAGETPKDAVWEEIQAGL